jgi:cytochrome P450
MTTRVPESRQKCNRASDACPALTPPVLQGYPLLGVLPRLLRDPTRALAQMAHENHGAVVALPFGPVTTYLVSHPDHVEYVLKKNWRNFPKGDSMWRPVRRLIGRGLVTSDGEQWQRQRRLMQPLFSARQLSDLGGEMIRVVDRCLDELEARAAPGGPVELTQEMAMISRRVILATIFGSHIEREESEAFGKALLTALHEINLRMFLYFLPERFPLPGNKRLRRAVLTVDETLRGILQRWKPATTNRVDLLSLLIEAGRATPEDAMDQRQMRDELVTLFVAGHESTSLAMSWLFYLLDRHPEVEERVRAELGRVVGDGPLAPEDLERLPYARMVIQESLRLYPPAWLFFRVSAEADRIGDYAIPACATVLMSPYITQRDPALWDEPEAFRPERFSPERAGELHRYAYFPFGGGPRLCIGNTLAMMEAQIILASILRRFRARLVPGHRVTPKSATGLMPREGLPMYILPA